QEAQDPERVVARREQRPMRGEADPPARRGGRRRTFTARVLRARGGSGLGVEERRDRVPGPLDRVAVVLASVACGDQHLAYPVDRVEQQRPRFLRQRASAAAYLIEQRLDAMRELADEAEAERARAALDRMRGAKDRVDALVVVRRIEDPVVEQLAFHQVQALEALVEERLDELRQVDAHGRRRTRSFV